MKLVSIIMNCFNGEKYLREALDSIINQTYENWELIFWDNISTDNSISILETYHDKRIRYFLADKHGTLGDGRSKAIEKVRGDYIAFLDTDDIWYEKRLEESVKAFQTSKNISLVYSNTEFFSVNSKKRLYKSAQPSGSITSKLLINYNLSLESVTISKKYLNKLDIMFDNKFSHIADFDLFVRLSTLGQCKYIDKVLCGWRMHMNNDSFKRPYLFILERRNWIEKYHGSKLFEGYKSEIDELNFLCKTEDKLSSKNIFDVNNILEIRKHKFMGKKNFIKYVISCLPLFKSFYKLRFLIKN